MLGYRLKPRRTRGRAGGRPGHYSVTTGVQQRRPNRGTGTQRALRSAVREEVRRGTVRTVVAAGWGGLRSTRVNLGSSAGTRARWRGAGRARTAHEYTGHCTEARARGPWQSRSYQFGYQCQRHFVCARPREISKGQQDVSTPDRRREPKTSPQFDVSAAGGSGTLRGASAPGSSRLSCLESDPRWGCALPPERAPLSCASLRAMRRDGTPGIDA